ncbi:MAG: hemerythrin family protein [Candidatus Woesearchaeota archaeon]
MEIVWTTDLSVKNGVIDGQHKQLISKINDLIIGINNGNSKDEIVQIMDFLSKYIILHLGYEEKYMAKYEYPNLEEHKIHHEILIETVKELSDLLIKIGPTESLAFEIKERVGNWFLSHIAIKDADYAKFIKEQPN